MNAAETGWAGHHHELATRRFHDGVVHVVERTQSSRRKHRISDINNTTLGFLECTRRVSFLCIAVHECCIIRTIRDVCVDFHIETFIAACFVTTG